MTNCREDDWTIKKRCVGCNQVRWLVEYFPNSGQKPEYIYSCTCLEVKSGSVRFPRWTSLSQLLLYLNEKLSLLFAPSSAESRVWLFTYLSQSGERCCRCQAACRLLQLTTSLLTHHSYISSKPGIILFRQVQTSLLKWYVDQQKYLWSIRAKRKTWSWSKRSVWSFSEDCTIFTSLASKTQRVLPSYTFWTLYLCRLNTEERNVSWSLLAPS